MRKIILMNCIGILLLSCLSENKEANFTVGTSHEVIKVGDKLKSEIEYIDDSVMHGVAKYYYYPTDVLSDEIEMRYGKKNGWHKHYRKDGTLESKTYFIKNIPNGKNIWYFNDGVNIEVENNWKDSIQYGQTKWLYNNGTIQTLSYSNLFGEVFYMVDYDSLGQKTHEEGFVFSPTLYTKNDGSKLPKNDILLIKVSVAELPNLYTTIKMGVLGEELKTLKIEDYTATYRNTFNEVGTYTLKTIGEIRESNGNLYKKDSITVDITVVD